MNMKLMISYDISFKTKFAISGNFADSQDLFEQSLNLVALYLSVLRILTRLDKNHFYVFKCGKN